MKLSKNFSLSEFTKSATAAARGIDNTPTPEVIKALQALVENVLQPIRDRFGSVTISSGYRSPQLNTAIGGSKTSDHCFGYAADFEVAGTDNQELAVWIKDNLNYKQLILEFYDDGITNSGWVHCSFVENDNKQQRLTAFKDGKKTKYKAASW